MILSDKDIREALSSGEIVIESPFDYKINPASIDFRLGTKLFRTRPTSMKGLNFGEGIFQGLRSLVKACLVIDPMDKSSFKEDIHDLEDLGPYYLRPGEFILASAAERIELNGNIAMKIFGKSSIGRLGLANSEVAGYVDPGFPGVLTLELKNHHHEYAIKLTPGMPIGQYVFMRTGEVEKSYRETGRYVNQGPGQGSLGI